MSETSIGADDAVATVRAWEALDSRGTPTLGCSVVLAGGAAGRAIVPSGASTGSHDARERRDGGQSWDGLGVAGAVRVVIEEIGPALAGVPAREVDAVLESWDPSTDLAELGVHAALGVSVAAHRARARAAGVPLYELLAGGLPHRLPTPMVNVVSGGAHAGGAVDIQDVLVMPLRAGSFRTAIEWAWRVRRQAAALAERRGLVTTLVADEGGLGLQLPSNAAALGLVTEAIEAAGLEPGHDAALAVDVAANQLWDGSSYRLAAESRRLDAAGLIDELAGWVAKYPVVSIEDPLHDQDWDGWAEATRRLRGTQLVGDDLFSTAADRVAEAARRGVGTSVLIKPNQRGILSRAAETVATARRLGYQVVVSARSGDTEDHWLADLAVGWRADQIKVGSTTRSERTAKWNRLLEIEASCAPDLRFVT
ncbi:phosphopyruvate hydratase [Phytoactinopolyspora limicola]|uniref:phosphopyruvate hydratase n=1 Tax=Phytoactinopolyspora limicola TaxID=2715536 RepID=UPI00140C5780|nr:phosphopyruvate hydratase [Phytoactinopolyspora limicola]